MVTTDDLLSPSTSTAAPRPATLRRRELGMFLRSRRERLSPDQVGLPPGGRRRTPGLRREEVASLAGVGVTWYTWLEQGRDISASTSVFEALARTLNLDPHERRHLLTLAGSPDALPLNECFVVNASIRAVLDQLDPFPAAVQNARCDLLAHNRGYVALFPELAELPPEDRNVLRLAFTSASFRARVVDADVFPRMVAGLRAAMAEHVAEPAWKSFVASLREASPQFADLWDRHEVRLPENKEKQFLSPRVGLLRFEHSNLWFGPRNETRLITYTPKDHATREALDVLVGLDPLPVSDPGPPEPRTRQVRADHPRARAGA